MLRQNAYGSLSNTAVVIPGHEPPHIPPKAGLSASEGPLPLHMTVAPTLPESCKRVCALLSEPVPASPAISTASLAAMSVSELAAAVAAAPAGDSAAEQQLLRSLATARSARSDRFDAVFAKAAAQNARAAATPPSSFTSVSFSGLGSAAAAGRQQGPRASGGYSDRISLAANEIEGEFVASPAAGSGGLASFYAPPAAAASGGAIGPGSGADSSASAGAGSGVGAGAAEGSQAPTREGVRSVPAPVSVFSPSGTAGTGTGLGAGPGAGQRPELKALASMLCLPRPLPVDVVAQLNSVLDSCGGSLDRAAATVLDAGGLDKAAGFAEGRYV